MSQAQRLTLSAVAVEPGLQVLAWAGDTLYGSRQYTLLGWSPQTDAWRQVGEFKPSPIRCVSVRNRLLARLMRDTFHAVAPLPDGSIVAVLPGVIARKANSRSHFEPTFRIARGTRPLALAVTPAGHVYWGEYFDNAGREAVHIYGSDDGGQSWNVAYTFPARTVRHVHSVTYDRYDDCLWILTGDESHECQIVRMSLDWRHSEVVLGGTQQTRAVTVVARDDALYFGSDTPDEPNHVYRLKRNGSVQRLASINGSSFWSCAVGGATFVSTAIEPSRVNHAVRPTLYGSADGDAWSALMSWPRDRWPSALFQYPNVILPRGDNSTDILAATTFAVAGGDGAAHLWRVAID